MQRVQYIGKRTYPRRYGPGVGYTTRRVPGYFRTPSRGVYTRRLRGRYSGGGSIKAQLRRLAEQKFAVTQESGTPVNASAQVYGLTTDIEPGSDAHTRVGDKITLNSIELRGRVTINDTDPAASVSLATLRLVVFKWYDDAQPVYSDIFEVDDTNGTTLVPAVHAPFNSDRKVKRKVLLDKLYTVHRGVTSVFNTATNQIISLLTAEMGTRVCFNHFIDLKKKGDRVRNVNYGAGSTDGVGNIYLVTISDANANGPVLAFNAKANYTDV